MSKEKKLIPELRFPEFAKSAAWEEDIVVNLVETITPPKKLTSSDYQNNGKFPIIDQSKSFYCGWTNDIDAVIKGNQPLIIFGDHTCILKMVNEPFVQGADGIKILKTKNKIIPEFLYQFLQHNEVKQEEYKRHFSILKEKNVLFPKKESGEQQKIASCLSSLDEVITAHSQKLELLKNHKKGLMQNLFPQEREKTPKYRFREFRNAKEWEYFNGDTLFDSISNKNHNSELPILAITQEYGAIPRELIDYKVIVTDKSIESYKVVEEGDFIISLRSFQGGIEYSNYKGICSPAYIILRKKSDMEDMFFKYYFKTDLYIRHLNKNLEGMRDGKMVSYKQFSEILLPLPSIQEQQKIADCLLSLDELIAAQAEKIEQLKLHKKGLMQRMFPKMNEV